MKRSLLLASLSGIMLSLSFPLAIFSENIFEKSPNGILIFFAFVPLLFSLDENNRRHPFLKGYITGFVFYLITLFWIVVAMHLFGGISIPGSITILFVLVLYLSLYLAFFSSLLATLRKRFPVVLVAPALFVSLELLRNYFLTGFPWANPGYALTKFEKLIQICDITGIYGLTFLIVFINASVYELINFLVKKRSFPIFSFCTSIALLLLLNTYGIIRVRGIDKSTTVASEKITIIQGNIPQDQKWSYGYAKKKTEKYLKLSKGQDKWSPSLIIWPEACLPYNLAADAKYVKILKRETFKSKFIIGSTSLIKETGKRTSFNSAFYASPNGLVIGRYDKIHLVPFSEHVLYEAYIPFMKKLIPPIAGDFVPGEEIKSFDLKGHLFGVLICFEVIFPELTRKFIKKGARFLVNITNDAWFGKTSGPHQHFDMARFRTIENRVYMARAANTGISALIDPAGRTVAETKLFEDGVINEKIEFKEIKSVYTKIGDTFAYLCILVTLFLLVFLKIYKKRQR